MIECYWCHKELGRYYVRYKGKNFCETDGLRCLKEYLTEVEHFDEIEDMVNQKAE